MRDDVAGLAAVFAEDLLEHMRVHNWTFDPAPEKPEPGELRQVWLPNGQHVAMLHQLSYAYYHEGCAGALESACTHHATDARTGTTITLPHPVAKIAAAAVRPACGAATLM